MAEPPPHPPPSSPPPQPPGRTPQPVISRSIVSLVCGLLSLPMCCVFGIPALILGGVAVWLGIWTLQHYHGTVTSEFASIAGLIGIITGAIGVVLGLIGTWLFLMGTFGVMLDRLVTGN